MAADHSNPFTRTFFGNTPEDPPIMYGSRMAVSELQSLNYVAGSAGWRLTQNGDAEFNGATLRATLESDNFVAGSAGWRLLNTGAAEFSEVTVRGSSTLAGASVTGNLTMTGSGKILTAASGRRLEIATATTSKVSIYTGDAAEQAPAFMDFVSAGDLLYNEIRSPQAQGQYGRILIGANKVSPNSTVDAFADVVNFQSDSGAQLTLGLSGTANISAADLNIFGSGGNIVEFWDNTGPTQRAYLDRASGRFVTSNAVNGAAVVGSYTGHTDYAMFANLNQVAVSSANYALVQRTAGGDNETVLNAATNGIVFIRRSNGGQALDLRLSALPALTGNTMIFATGSAQVGYLSSSSELKTGIRDLDTSGADNPIWKLRPVRFSWDETKVANGAEANAKNPDGVPGLIAEEVAEAMPDAAVWSLGAEEEKVTGIDNDRLIAYLIDAVHYLKEKVSR